MARLHTYNTVVTWTGNQGTGTSGVREYSSAHEVSAAGPEIIPGSADPTFGGDRLRWNPEQMLVAAVSQCHMLWYLYLCCEAGVVVIHYVDEAVGTMSATAQGGRFTEVLLKPRVTVTAPEMIETAARLHIDAHRACFIANSVNFPVRHEPHINTEDQSASSHLFL